MYGESFSYGEYAYEGEVDEKGDACGYGVAWQGKDRYEGTFYKNRMHGLSR